MSNLTLFHEYAATGIIQQEVDIPIDVPEIAYIELIITGGADNIFDIEFITEVFENGAWRVQDRSIFYRGIEDAEEPMSGRMKAQLPNIGGKTIRTTLNCGQSLIAVDATLVWQ